MKFVIRSSPGDYGCMHAQATNQQSPLQYHRALLWTLYFCCLLWLSHDSATVANSSSTRPISFVFVRVWGLTVGRHSTPYTSECRVGYIVSYKKQTIQFNWFTPSS